VVEPPISVDSVTDSRYRNTSPWRATYPAVLTETPERVTEDKSFITSMIGFAVVDANDSAALFPGVPSSKTTELVFSPLIKYACDWTSGADEVSSTK
jgi:hypothetical protein